MIIRPARREDAAAIAAIYAPIVLRTGISFEVEAPTVDEMEDRVASTLQALPWLVAVDEEGVVEGYAYASRHRDRSAYRWAVDVSAYVHEEARGRGVGSALYRRLLIELTDLGYIQAFAGIALPNAASVALHESVGFVAIGIYRRVGYKLGQWRDVGWWQRELQAPPMIPAEPKAFALGA